MDESTDRIEGLSSNSSVAEIATVVSEVFRTHFGVTTDDARIKDIEREVHEFLGALSRGHRIGEYGDVLCTLLAFAYEQDVDPVKMIKQTLAKIQGRAELYAARGNKKNIAIFGITGDPPSIGHIAVAKAVLNSTIGIDEVWFMPPFNYAGSKRPAAPQHRAAMCRLLENVDPRFKFFGYEMDHRLSGETLHTLLRLSQDPLADLHRFHFILSVESAEQLPSWPRADELQRAAIFITVPRPGHTPGLKNLWFANTPHVYLGEAQGLVDVSSTGIRNAVVDRDWDMVTRLCTPEIAAYIQSNELYLPA